MPFLWFALGIAYLYLFGREVGKDLGEWSFITYVNLGFAIYGIGRFAAAMDRWMNE